MTTNAYDAIIVGASFAGLVPRRWLGGVAEIARRTQRRWWPQYAGFGRLQDRGARCIDDISAGRGRG